MDEKQTLCYVVNMLPTLKGHQKTNEDLMQSLLVKKNTKSSSLL